MKKGRDVPNRMLKDDERPSRIMGPEPPPAEKPQPEPEPKKEERLEILCKYCQGRNLLGIRTCKSGPVSQHPIEYVYWRKYRCNDCGRQFTVQERRIRKILA